MTAHRKITIELSADAADALEQSVARGEYASIDAAVEDALAEHETSRWDAQIGRDRLRAMIQEGIDSGHGEDGDAFFARMKAKYAAMAAEQKK